MNLDSDDECTCDVGVFATCPVCEASKLREALRPKERREPERQKPSAPHVVDLMLHYQKLAKEERKR